MENEGKEIRERREALGLSQDELGERVGLSERTIWAIENTGHRAREHSMNRLYIELGMVGDEETTRTRWPIRIQVVAAAIGDLLSSLPEQERHDWADDMSMRVVNDDARIAERRDWPDDIQIIANMVGAYLARED